MLQNHKDRLLIGTTTNSILTAALSATALRNPLAGIELDKTALTMVWPRYDDTLPLKTRIHPHTLVLG